MRRLRRLLPSPEAVQRNRWLAWMGPALHHPRLWHLSRRGLALGMALGIFFGLLIPIAQIPASAAAAVLLRANLPAAIASTLVTNPVTFGPVYYAAWRVGSAILGEPVAEHDEPPEMPEVVVVPDQSWLGWFQQQVLGVGKPLLVGLCVLATAFGLVTYFAVMWLWTLRVLWRRRHRTGSPAQAQ
jgi:uncharacterized protein (DUF2062 family)